MKLRGIRSETHRHFSLKAVKCAEAKVISRKDKPLVHIAPVKAPVIKGRGFVQLHTVNKLALVFAKPSYPCGYNRLTRRFPRRSREHCARARGFPLSPAANAFKSFLVFVDSSAGYLRLVPAVNAVYLIFRCVCKLHRLLLKSKMNE